MSKLEIILSEYKSLRYEISNRVKLLHLFILVGNIFTLAFIFMAFALYYSGVSAYEIAMLLLFVPIVFSLLIFNYQSNQMTLEGLAGYIVHELRKKLPEEDQKEFDAWDVYYGGRKKNYQLISFLKTMSLLLPMTLPIWLFVFASDLMDYPLNILAFVDLALFAFVIFNFRYKIGR